MHVFTSATCRDLLVHVFTEWLFTCSYVWFTSVEERSVGLSYQDVVLNILVGCLRKIGIKTSRCSFIIEVCAPCNLSCSTDNDQKERIDVFESLTSFHGDVKSMTPSPSVNSYLFQQTDKRALCQLDHRVMESIQGG